MTEPLLAKPYGFFARCCCWDWAAIRSAAVLSASCRTTDCSVTTCWAVFRKPEATCIAAALSSGSDAIRSARACTAAESSSSDFCNSGDGLILTESSARVDCLAGAGGLSAGCCDRAAEVVATPATRIKRSAMRFIIIDQKLVAASQRAVTIIHHECNRVSPAILQFTGQQFRQDLRY